MPANLTSYNTSYNVRCRQENDVTAQTQRRNIRENSAEQFQGKKCHVIHQVNQPEMKE